MAVKKQHNCCGGGLLFFDDHIFQKPNKVQNAGPFALGILLGVHIDGLKVNKSTTLKYINIL